MAHDRCAALFQRPRQAFTLIEVMVCSIVFLLMSISLASLMQVGAVADREERIASEIATNMVIGRRLLLEGAPPGTPVGDKGLLTADSAVLAETRKDLEEDADGLVALEYTVAEERYRLWLASPSSVLVRHRVFPSILARETIMGDVSMDLKVAALEGKPLFEDSQLPGLVVCTWLVYEDRNGNDLQDADEPSVPFRCAVSLRNSP